MNESEKTSVHLPFNIRLVRRNVDRIIVPSIRLVLLQSKKYDIVPINMRFFNMK